MSSKTHKPFPPAENPPEAGQEKQPKAPELVAVLTEIEAILRSFEGWQWAYKNINQEIVTLRELNDAILQLHVKFGGLACLLELLRENSIGLTIEQQEALYLASDCLREEKEKIESIWPCSANDALFVHIADLKEGTE